jgi:hypothetical protein
MTGYTVLQPSLHPAAAAINRAFNVVDGTPLPMWQYFSNLARIARRTMLPVPFPLLRGMAGGLDHAYRLFGREAPVVPRPQTRRSMPHQQWSAD